MTERTCQPPATRHEAGGNLRKEAALATILQAARTCRTLAELAVALPDVERHRWLLLADLLRPLADAREGAVQAWDASDWFAGRVRAVRGRLPPADPAGRAMVLVGRWLDGWLAQHADQDGRAQAQAFAATAATGRVQPEQDTEMQGLAEWPAPEQVDEEQLLVSRAELAAQGWAQLVVAGVTVEDEGDVRRRQALSDAADLLCPARGYIQQASSHELEIAIGPPAGSDQPAADQLVAELAALAFGLSPGQWQIHTT